MVPQRPRSLRGRSFAASRRARTFGSVPLTLVTGPANAGKAGRILGAYRDRIADEPILVVPALRDVRHAQRELAERGAVFGTNVVRFGWLFRTVAERCDPALGTARRATYEQRELL